MDKSMRNLQKEKLQHEICSLRIDLGRAKSTNKGKTENNKDYKTIKEFLIKSTENRLHELENLQKSI